MGVKGAIVQIDATPFRQWFSTHYGLELGKKAVEAVKVSKSVTKKRESRQKGVGATMDPAVAEQFKTGRLLASIASRRASPAAATATSLRALSSLSTSVRCRRRSLARRIKRVQVCTHMGV